MREVLNIAVLVFAVSSMLSVGLAHEWREYLAPLMSQTHGKHAAHGEDQDCDVQDFAHGAAVDVRFARRPLFLDERCLEPLFAAHLVVVVEPAVGNVDLDPAHGTGELRLAVVGCDRRAAVAADLQRFVARER